jgi:two-component system response regulator AtoC
MPGIGLQSQFPLSLPPDEVIFGKSEAMRAIRQKLEKVCRTNVPVVIQGDGGTGKEILGRWIHSHSPWCTGPFIKINCAAIPESLLESELFGYQKGAFTGAYTSKPGRVELAHSGTLFLDEIAELDLAVQAKLLQFLQDGGFSRIGGDEEHRVESRVICATGRNLAHEVDAGRFRPDLFYRINVICIQTPRLHDRREDIALLSDYFLSQFNARFQRSAPVFSKELLHLLQVRDWPGNIRELENRVARYVILGAEDDTNQVLNEQRRLPAPQQVVANGSLPLTRLVKQATREMERNVILAALQANYWNRRRTAEALKIGYRALIYKIREAGLSPRRSVSQEQAGASAADRGSGTF